MSDNMVTPHYEREPENAPGPFYVGKDMCLTCSLPVGTAPETIRYHDKPCARCPEGCPDHCYVSRQPETPEEISRMLEVVAGSCIAAYRYCGTDPGILRRLVEAGCKEQCDALIPKPMTTPTEPKLAPPGAGLPAVELFIGRRLFALRRMTGNRETFNARFHTERELIRTLVSGCDAESGACRVLIKRPLGLEDSSRYWSVWMTLDHLRIVHGEFLRVIAALTQGMMPEGEASTAAVKPAVAVGPVVVDAYEASCDALLAVVAAAPDLETPLRFAHPWFGPQNAAGWHALAGGHMGIHRVQIQRILAGLPTAGKG